MRAWLVLVAGCDAIYGLEHKADEEVGIIARYPMNDLGATNPCMTDVVGGHDGACEGDPITLVPSECGSGYHFDGSATIHIGAASTFKLQAFTIVYQLHLDAPVDTGICPVEHVYGAADENSWSYCFEKLQTDLAAADGTGSNTGVNQPGDPLDETRWHQIAISYGGGTMTGYIDAVPGPVLSLPQVLYDNDDTVLGADIQDGTPHRTLTGSLDDVRIFDRVLTQADLEGVSCE